MQKHFYFLTVIVSLFLAASCNKDEEIAAPDSHLPRISVDSETGVYSAKIGKTVVITPTVENAENAIYSWRIDNELVSTERVFEYVFDQEGSVYVTLRVDNRYGTAEMELRVDVGQLALPLISLSVPSGFELLSGREYTFEPEVQNAEDARYEWYLDDSEEPVCTEKNYTFMQTELKTYKLRLKAINEDGEDEKEIEVKVVDAIKVKITFVPSYYFADPLDRSVSLGRTIFLRPFVENAVDPEYAWYVNGVRQDGATERMFAFKPESKGTYAVRFVVTDTDESVTDAQSATHYVTRASSRRTTEVELTVTCYESETDRAIVTTGEPASDKVLEFLPAPGQFVNEKGLAGYTNERTFEEARQYAERRLKGGSFISLGAWGGYVILGFDHSVENKGGYQGYDFSIAGNQFGGSNEPGIVWVMQDVNGNNKPDDEWYELRGSETGKEWTVQEYAVTYYKPSGRRQSVKWTDNLGKSGSVAYLEQYHPQDYYYPLWLEEESYTYYGTGLRQNTTHEDIWVNHAYEWGYVDNMGSDNLDYPEKTCKTYFKISNAITLDGQPADLRYIDFIKVQGAVNGSAGGLGENSCEVVGMAIDENLNH